ncbi:MAG: cupin domain-containing protein [Thermoanaerobaculia bacterium]
MKRLGLALLVPGALALAATALAQDPAKVAPDVYNCVFENDQVRVCEVALKPGGKVAMHSHPDHFMYVTAPGKLKITASDGKVTEGEFTVGQVVWVPAETHWAMNPGTTELKGIVVELKKSGAPAAK